VTGHSHDHAVHLTDRAAVSEGRRVLVVSLLGLLVTAGLQAVVVAMSGSVALILGILRTTIREIGGRLLDAVGEAHALAHRPETQLITDVARLSAATIHVSPRGVHHG